MLKEKLEGLRLSIIDDTRVENLHFVGDTVVTTIGTKDGPLCGPILDYEVTGPDALVIDFDGAPIRWSHIEIGDQTVSVVRNGVKTSYRVEARH